MPLDPQTSKLAQQQTEFAGEIMRATNQHVEAIALQRDALSFASQAFVTRVTQTTKPNPSIVTSMGRP